MDKPLPDFITNAKRELMLSAVFLAFFGAIVALGNMRNDVCARCKCSSASSFGFLRYRGTDGYLRWYYLWTALLCNDRRRLLALTHVLFYLRLLKVPESETGDALSIPINMCNDTSAVTPIQTAVALELNMLRYCS